MNEKQVQRIILNCTLLALVVIAIAGWGISVLNRSVKQEIRALRVSWKGTSLWLTSASDGPFVVMHLYRKGASEPEKSVATLPEPLAIVDSGGVELNAEALKRLVWRSGLTQQEVPAPTPGEPIWALYYRPSLAQPRDSKTE
jgi:hypothetical protein